MIEVDGGQAILGPVEQPQRFFHQPMRKRPAIIIIAGEGSYHIADA
jgi:hypothetical protein